MSNSWSGGKGDKSRITDYKSYSSNFDNIKGFGKKKDMVTPKVDRALFLDDVRTPDKATLWNDGKVHLVEASGIPRWSWDIVKSYEEFVSYIDTNGIPDVVSFDNDLFDVGDPTVSHEEVHKLFEMENWQEFRIKTGAHCAEYLVNACKSRGVDIPRYYIHTANSKAYPVIKQILENARNDNT